MDVKYDDELVKEIQEIFMHKIVLDNFIFVIHKYNRNVLTNADIDRLQKRTSFKSSIEVNYELLSTMKKYKGWFEVILQVCNDPDVKQDDLAVAFKTIKQKLDERLARDHTEKNEMDMELSNLFCTSESNQRTVAMECQLSANGGQGAVSSESRWQEDRSSNQLSKDKDRVPTHLSSWTGVKRENDKPTIPTSFTLSGSCETIHSGQISGSKMTTASFKLTISNDNTSTSPSAIKAARPQYGATKAISSDTGVFEARHASSNVTDATLVSSDSSHAIDAYTKHASGSEKENIVEDGNGKLKCRVCNVPVTSDYNAIEHLQGKKHKKQCEALKDLDGTPSSNCAVNGTPACCGANCKQASGTDKEYIVEDVNGKLKCTLCDVPFKSLFNATEHLQGSKHKKKHKALKRF